MKTIDKADKLKKLGFKKKQFEDKSGIWWEKRFKLGEYKAKFYCDYRFNLIEIETLQHFSNQLYKKSYDAIWAGNWKQFIKKVNKYEKNLKK